MLCRIQVKLLSIRFAAVVAAVIALSSIGQAQPVSAVTFRGSSDIRPTIPFTYGYVFNVTRGGLSATHLGIWAGNDGLVENYHEIGLWAPDGRLIASGILPATTQTTRPDLVRDGFAYMDIADVPLPPGEGYSVGALWNPSSDPLAVVTPSDVIATGGIAYVGARLNSGMALARPTTDSAQPRIGASLMVTDANQDPLSTATLGAMIGIFDLRTANVGAPCQLSSLYGSNMGPVSGLAAQALPLPIHLGGFQVLVDELPVPVQYVSASQVNFVVPCSVALGRHAVKLAKYSSFSPTAVSGPKAGESSALEIAVNPTTPVFFSVDQAGPTPVRESPGPADQVLVTTASPARAGEILTIYADGLGDRVGGVPADPGSPDPRRASKPVQIFVDGVEASLLYAGGSGFFPGVDQINFIVPAVRGGSLPFKLLIDGVAFDSSLPTR